MENLHNDLKQTCNEYSIPNVDNLHQVVLNTFNSHAQTITKKFTQHTIRKYVSPITKILIKDCTKLYRSLKKNPNPMIKFKLAKLKKSIRKHILNDTKRELQHQIDNKGFWK